MMIPTIDMDTAAAIALAEPPLPSVVSFEVLDGVGVADDGGMFYGSKLFGDLL